MNDTVLGEANNMKIIGTTETGFILTATKDEVANLLGFYYACSEDARRAGVPSLKAGDEIQIGAMYKQLAQLAENQNTLLDVRRVLRNIADSLELVDPVIRLDTK